MVTRVGWVTGYDGYGMIVEVQLNERYSTLYAHLSKATVHVGQRVRAGERLGIAGCTGWCTGTTALRAPRPRSPHRSDAADHWVRSGALGRLAQLGERSSTSWGYSFSPVPPTSEGPGNGAFRFPAMNAKARKRHVATVRQPIAPGASASRC